ncbi:MAG: type I-C CRISPR-associated protein Cas8c/Csd1 [Deltaproteobacteria bacterium]|nr:type I-C CRISPR-associated protein Cas8c/Csd1 [Deltaproteobacteria bacterium]
MILQELVRYYDRKLEEDGDSLPLLGFERKEIPFIIVLDQSGNFVDLEDTRSGEGRKKRSRVFTVPQAVKRARNVEANLLWDNAGYVLGISEEKRKQIFIEKIETYFPDQSRDNSIQAVLDFLKRGDFEVVFSHPLWAEIKDLGGNISFRIAGETELICEKKVVKEVVQHNNSENSEEKQWCLISGQKNHIAILHPAIKGVRNANSSGANIISFNLDAFRSFGKEQGLNSPIGTKPVFAYTTALNHLLGKDSRQKMQVGDASTIFWAEKMDQMENVFADLFGWQKGDSPDRHTEAVRALYAAPSTGAPPLDEDQTRFFILGLSPNAARIAVRFWHATTVGKLAGHIRQHFDDLLMIHGDRDLDSISLYRLLCSIAAQGKSENIPPNLAGDTMKSILQGTPYPQTLLQGAIRRIKAEREVTYPRAALIKALLVRNHRYYKKTEKEVSMSLDENNLNLGYQVGRLFAVLEKIQEEANPGINATIRDRFYASASATPATAFPLLMKLKNHHLAKMENRGRVVNMERLLGQIIGSFQEFPARMDLSDQGRFAVGYYHQRQAFFQKKETNDNKGEQS